MNGCTSLIGTVWDWSEYGWTLAVEAGVRAGLLATAVLLINVLFRSRLSSRQMGLLWGVVLVRLLIPVAPSSAVSFENLAAWAVTETTEPTPADLESGTDRGAAPHSQWFAATSAAADPQLSAPDAEPGAIDPSDVVDRCTAMLPLVWLVGAAACLIRTMVVHWRFCRALKQAAACEDPRQLGLWEECCKRVGMRRNIPVFLFDGIEQPAVFGLFRPRLLLPANAAELNDEQLRMIMFHELAHVRYGDIAANWALVVIRAIHWWNPLFWLAAARYQSLREQACDAFAVRQIEGLPVRNYSELLLTLVRRPSASSWRVALSASILGFYPSFFRKLAIRNRLRALRSAGVTRSRRHTAGAVCLIALAAVCGLTDASSPAAPPEGSSDWLPPADCAGNSWEWSPWSPPIDPGPNVTRTYDIEKALRRISADARTKDGARREMNVMLLQIVGSCLGRSFASTDEEAKEMIALGHAVLTLKAPLPVHAEVVKNLKAWEQSGLGQISMEASFITGERDIASAIGVSWRYLEAFSSDRDEELPSETGIGAPGVRAKAYVDDYVPVAVATLDARRALALRQAAQSDRRANIVQAPKVTLFNGQRALIVDRTQSPFVVGIQHDGGDVRRPKIAVIDEGIKLTLRAIQNGDGTKSRLEGRIELSEIGEVRTASTELRGESTTIQLPRVKRCRIDIASEIQDGDSLLIGCIPAYEKKQFFYMLLTAHNLRPPTGETK